MIVLAETTTEAIERSAAPVTVARAVERIIEAHPGNTVAIVCHGGVINAWASHVLGLPDPLFFEPHYTSVNRFLASSRGHRSLVSLNDLGHLHGTRDVTPA